MSVRIGIIGTDGGSKSGHAVEICRIISGRTDAEVSAIFGEDKECTKQLYETGTVLSIAETPEELAAVSDAVMILNRNGRKHIKYAMPFLEKGIPVFIDSRADLYLPEFNGEKDQNGKYVGRDIMTDFLDISGIACNYESKFEEYDITHAVLLTNSKLNSLISKDINYKQLYKDDYFVIYERGNR